ncbi:MAG: hypothetical protein LRS46_01460 [Desulfurococcales archaeon]|nr:hypothetical protein [Desulfurococcales archaeon]
MVPDVNQLLILALLSTILFLLIYIIKIIRKTGTQQTGQTGKVKEKIIEVKSIAREKSREEAITQTRKTQPSEEASPKHEEGVADRSGEGIETGERATQGGRGRGGRFEDKGFPQGLSPEEYSWILKLGKRRKQKSSSNT